MYSSCLSSLGHAGEKLSQVGEQQNFFRNLGGQKLSQVREERNFFRNLGEDFFFFRKMHSWPLGREKKVWNFLGLVLGSLWNEEVAT